MKESDVDRFEAFMNENIKTQEKEFLETFDQKVLPDCLLIGEFVSAYKENGSVHQWCGTVITRTDDCRYLRLNVTGQGKNILMIDEVFPIYPAKFRFAAISEIDGILNLTRAVEFVNPDCEVGQIWEMPNDFGIRQIVADSVIS